MKLLARIKAAANALRPSNSGETRISRGMIGDSGWYYTKLAPAQVKALLIGMRQGNLVDAYELFSEMQDTWHTLAKNLQQLREAVAAVKYVVTPDTEEGESATDTAVERAKLCRKALADFIPDPASDENGFEDFIYDLTDALVMGINVQEILWDFEHDEGVMPRATVWVHPCQYGFDTNGRLCRNDARTGLVEFEENKFIIASYKTRSGTRTMNGLLRPLAWWWCAVQFGRDWVLRNAELFGQPLRDIEYDPNIKPEDLAELKAMAANMGSTAWITRPAGSKINFIEAQKTGDASPQAELLDRADTACDLMILWQTLTSTTQGTGSLALGDVHKSVLDARKQNIAKWAANIISYQLFPAICRANYGDDEECPVATADQTIPELPKDKAARFLIAKQIVPLPKTWTYNELGIPVPEAGEETLAASVQPSAISPEGRASAPPPLHASNDNRDVIGRYADGPGGGGSGSTAKSPDPKEISIEEADARLTKGETEKGVNGKSVHFGERLKTKLESQPSYAARKKMLEWGQDAVRSGVYTQHVDKSNGELRDYYAKTFQVGDKHTLVIVDAKDGEAFNLFHSDPRYLTRKGYLKARDGGSRRDEQPSPGILQACAAASCLPDYLDYNTALHAVNTAPSADDKLRAAAAAMMGEAQAKALTPVANRLRAILALSDETAFNEELKALQADLLKLFTTVAADPGPANILSETIAAAMLNGMTKENKR